jgi:serine/threonine protein kinase
METIGSYQILNQIGAGGMGAVFLAEHRFLKRRSAIKMLMADLASRPDVLERFFAEARATSQLEHPGIVRIFDCQMDAEGRPYIVMEYLEGETLGAHLRRMGRLGFSEAAGYAAALADALGAAHERGIVHRDLKPDNVFVRPGPVPAIKLVDFGIAKLAEELRAGARTQTGTLLGTPPYMSPEQCRGAGSVDHRTDIYSLGCVLFEMLCGVPPFQRDSTGAFLIAHITQVPPLAQEVNPAVPVELGGLIARMLAKAPEQRPQTMRQVVEALRPFAAGAPAVAATVPPAPAVAASAPTPAPPLRAPISIPAVDSPGAAPVPTPATPANVANVANLPSAPRTTLQSNAGELVGKAPALRQGLDEADLGAPPARKRGGLVLGAVLALGLVGFTVWKLVPPSAAVGSAAAPAGATAADSRPGQHKTDRQAVKAAHKPASAPVVPAGQPPGQGNPNALAAAPASGLPAAGSASAKARGFVIIDIDSQPTGALICFEGDPRIISATRRAVQLPYADQDVTFLVDLPGYKPGRFTVRGNRDARKVVRLQAMPAGQGRRPVCSY